MISGFPRISARSSRGPPSPCPRRRNRPSPPRQRPGRRGIRLGQQGPQHPVAALFLHETSAPLVDPGIPGCSGRGHGPFPGSGDRGCHGGSSTDGRGECSPLRPGRQARGQTRRVHPRADHESRRNRQVGRPVPADELQIGLKAAGREDHAVAPELEALSGAFVATLHSTTRPCSTSSRVIRVFQTKVTRPDRRQAR